MDRKSLIKYIKEVRNKKSMIKSREINKYFQDCYQYINDKKEISDMFLYMMKKGK